MQLTYILCTFIAVARYSSSSPVHDSSSCATSTSEENIALVQRQASVLTSRKQLGSDLTNETMQHGKSEEQKCTAKGHWLKRFCDQGIQCNKGKCGHCRGCANGRCVCTNKGASGECAFGVRCKNPATPSPTPAPSCEAPSAPVATCAAWGDPHYFASFHKGGKKIRSYGVGSFSTRKRE